MKNKFFWAIITGMVISSAVSAQEQPQAQKNLMQFVGNWTSKDIQISVGNDTYGGDYTFDCLAVNMNTGILAHEKFVNQELGTLLAENLLGYDPNLQQIHLYTIDNMGTAHDHYGYWLDDHHLFLQYQGVVDGKMYVEQLDIIIQNENTMVLKSTAMLNGETIQKAEGTFVK